MRHADDATSVNMIVNELRGEPYGPILLYKPQHNTSPEFATIPDNVFILGILTQWRKRGVCKVCKYDVLYGFNPWHKCIPV